MRLFGFEIKRAEDFEPPVSFAPENNDDGAISIASGGAYGQYLDLESSVKSEAELVNRYRTMAMNSEVDTAIKAICNEAIVVEDGKKTIELILDELEVKDSFKQVLQQEFEHVLRLLEFDTKAYEIFEAWYRDGRLYYHKIVTPGKEMDGIKELRYLDPRKIRKVRESKKKRQQMGPQTQPVTLEKDGKEYFLYAEKGFVGNKWVQNTYANQVNIDGTNAIRIARDSILHCTSGILDATGKMVLGHLHKAIRPLNQLRAMEDATIIYRISRAPERRVFYIDVGSLPKMKAEQHLKEMMTRYKNRLVYNAETGEVRDDRRFWTMLEDFWLPRREGGRGTEISTLPAGQNLGKMEDVEYFQGNMFKSLNVPVSRLNPETMFNVGRATEISRDEVAFAKFVDRLRIRFNKLFLDTLETQLVLKQIVSPDEWEEIKDKIRFQYLRDNYFAELKESEIIMERFNRIQQIDPYVGKYVSAEWVRRNVLYQSDDEMMEIDFQVAQETQNPQYQPGLGAGQALPAEPEPVPSQEEVESDPRDEILKEELIYAVRKMNDGEETD